jgi:hypothetical protein
MTLLGNMFQNTEAEDNVLPQGENWLVGPVALPLRARVEHDAMALILISAAVLYLEASAPKPPMRTSFPPPTKNS